MAEEKEHGGKAAAASTSPSGEGAGGADSQTGDPGRTPSKAEGDEETVEESLRQKGDD